MIIQAKHLRNSDELKNVPDNRPGWYRWWTQEEEVRALLNSRFISRAYFDDLISVLRKGDGALRDYYYVYTGITVKDSIRSRLNWHINQHHTDSAVHSGRLSTLRQTIASLVAGNQWDEAATNNFIDKMTVEYFPVEYPIKSEKAKAFLEDNEKKEMRDNVLPLNIQNNKRVEVYDFIHDLKDARKSGKEGV